MEVIRNNLGSTCVVHAIIYVYVRTYIEDMYQVGIVGRWWWGGGGGL